MKKKCLPFKHNDQIFPRFSSSNVEDLLLLSSFISLLNEYVSVLDCVNQTTCLKMSHVLLFSDILLTKWLTEKTFNRIIKDQHKRDTGWKHYKEFFHLITQTASAPSLKLWLTVCSSLCCCSRWHPGGGDPQRRDGGGEGPDGGVTGLVQPHRRHFQKLCHLAVLWKWNQAGEKVAT